MLFRSFYGSLSSKNYVSSMIMMLWVIWCSNAVALQYLSVHCDTTIPWFTLCEIKKYDILSKSGIIIIETAAGQPFGPRWPGVGAGHSLVVVLAIGTVRVRQRDAVRPARSPGNPRDRHPTREIAG